MISRDFFSSKGPRGFGDDSDATAEVNSAADKLISLIQELINNAIQATYWVPNADNAQGQLVNTYPPQIQDWSTTRRAWASDGSGGPNGTYTWERWFNDGQQYANSVKALTQQLNEQSVWSQALQTLSDIAGTVSYGVNAAAKIAKTVVDKCAADPSSCTPAAALDAAFPTWLKVVLVVGVFGYLASGTSKVIGR
jgi:hypothetical protein